MPRCTQLDLGVCRIVDAETSVDIALSVYSQNEAFEYKLKPIFRQFLREDGNLFIPYNPFAVREGYTTRYGGFANSSMTYADSISNYCVALRRMCCKRKPGVLAPDGTLLHDFLKARHYTNFNTSLEFNNYMNDLRRKVRDRFADKDSWFEELREFCHDKTHPKYKERMAGWRDIVEYGLDIRMSWLQVIKAKFKKDETAKPGKYGRLISSLGVLPAIQSGYVMKVMKEVMSSNPCEMENFKSIYCLSSSYEELRNVFRDALESARTMTFVYHSDDSFCVVNRAGVREMYKIDISSADQSHNEPVAACILSMSDDNVGVRHAIDACRQDQTLSWRHIKIGTLKNVLREFHCYSGFSGTTLANCIASCRCAVECYRLLLAGDLDFIVNGFRHCGYIATIEKVDDIVQLDFLKHFPYIVDGEVECALSYGVPLRTFGKKRGDLAGSGTIVQRFNVYNYSLYLTYRTFRGCELSRILEKLYKSVKGEAKLRSKVEGSYLLDNMVGERFERGPSVNDVCRRYGFDLCDYYEFLELVSSSKASELIYHPCIDRIFEVDYGYGPLCR